MSRINDRARTDRNGEHCAVHAKTGLAARNGDAQLLLNGSGNRTNAQLRDSQADRARDQREHRRLDEQLAREPATPGT